MGDDFLSPEWGMRWQRADQRNPASRCIHRML